MNRVELALMGNDGGEGERLRWVRARKKGLYRQKTIILVRKKKM